MRSLRFMPVTFALAALAACSSRDDPEDAATPTPVLTTQAAPTEAADGTALTPGKWEVGEDANGATATYAEAGKAPVAVLACDRSRSELNLTVAATGPAPAVYRLHAGAMLVGVSMTLVPGNAGMVTAIVDQTQPIFSALADPATVLEISGPGMTMLRLPGNSGISRVITACT